jgi:DNA-binding MarR family transcriptional regulator
MSEIDDAASRLRAVFRQVSRRTEALGGKDSPTRSEQSVLAWLEDKGPMTQRALSDIQQVRPQSMQQTLDSLERRRWIRREDHPTDRRQLLISLSATGRKALLKGRQLRQAWLVSEITKLSRAERKTLSDALGILERFLKNPHPSKS